MKKKFIISLISVLAMLVLIISFNVWNANHPIIEIEVIKKDVNDVLSLDKPKITIFKRSGIKASAEIQLELLEIEWAHQDVFVTLYYEYEYADINLLIEKEKNKLKLIYTGTVTKIGGKSEPYKNEIEIDLNSEASIKNYKR